MFERFSRNRGRRDADDGGVATETAPPAATRTAEPAPTRAAEPAPRQATATVREPVEAPAARRARAGEEFGGTNWGSAFFGWLVAIGMSVILLALLSAAGAAVGLSTSPSTTPQTAGTTGIVGGALLVLALMIAYYCGGYVAGRMSRFDAGRQGVGVWVIGLLMTIVAAAAGALLGSEFNVFSQLELPRIPIDEGTLATGGLITLAAIVLGTLLAAAAGGKAGWRYHRRVDRAGL